MVLTVADAIRSRLAKAVLYARIRSRDFEPAARAALIPINGDLPASLGTRLASKVRTALAFCRFNVIVDVGGYQFGDRWGAAIMHKSAQTAKRHAWLKHQVFYMPQAWGPFTGPAMKRSLRSIIDESTLCYVRDKTSLAAVEDVVGASHPKVRLAHDIAWRFRGADGAVGRRLLQEAGLREEKGRLIVCVTPNMRLYEKYPKTGADNAYVKFLAALVEHLCLHKDAQVVLVGHDLAVDDSKRSDDRALCRHLLGLVAPSLPVMHVDRVLSAAEIKSVIGNCDLLVSSRYHALIGALSQGIPVAAIGWSHKYDELLAEFGLGRNLLSLSESVSGAYESLDRIIHQLPQCAESIRQQVPRFKESAQRVLDEVISMVQERFGDSV
jgi:polysaccharide pyruvyl transferase WcaK-like protein